MTVTDDIGSACFDHVEPVGRITLMKHRLAGGHVDRFQAARELFDRRQRQRLQHRKTAEQPNLFVEFSDIAVRSPQATPCRQHQDRTDRTDGDHCHGHACQIDQQ